MTWSAGKWWRRAAAAMKDKRSVYLCRAAGSGQRSEIEAAVIRATSHDDRSIDYKNAARVFAWARASPSSFSPVMRALARRATRTGSWAVALKALLLSHGVLLCSSAADRLGRLPFDLSDFRDCRSGCHGFSAFVRAYFHYLDRRSVFLSSPKPPPPPPPPPVSSYPQLDMLAEMQDLLDLLMQIRPYAGGMEVGLILEAMDCAIIEIFEIYGEICSGIAGFLAEERRPVGLAGMRILRRAAEQGEQLTSYFGLCRSLGVLNAAEIPTVETIPGEDIRDLEDLVRGGVERRSRSPAERRSEIVVTEEWEVFEDEFSTAPANSNENPFFCLEDGYKSVHRSSAAPFAGGNLIELI